MTDICPKCGLPKELCVCDVLDKEVEGKIRVYVKKAKFDKLLTIVEGVNPDEVEDTTKDLKRSLACGGTSKGSVIELQGNHKGKVKAVLVGLGYKENNIDIT